MELWEIVRAVLALVLLVAVIFAFIGPIRKVYNSLKPLGEAETTQLADAKKKCDEAQTQYCALDVAKLSLQEKESSLVVESWLRREIKYAKDNGLNDQVRDKAYVNDILDFAKQLYATTKDYRGAVQTYTLLSDISNTEAVMVAKLDAQLDVNIGDLLDVYNNKMHYPAPGTTGAIETYAPENRKLLQQTAPLLQQTLDFYRQNKAKINDKPILGDPQIENVCELMFKKVGFDADSCNMYLRASLNVSCFAEGGTCKSCRYYSLESLDPHVDICSGYHLESSCTINPCNIGNCEWIGLVGFKSCKSKAK